MSEEQERRREVLGAPSLPVATYGGLAVVGGAALAAIVVGLPPERRTIAALALSAVLAVAYLAFRFYRVHASHRASERRHRDETSRLLEAVRESEQRYALAAAGSNDGLWDWDVAAGAVSFSDRWRQILGLPAHVSLDTLEDWLALVIAEDRQFVKDVLTGHLASGVERFEQEYRVRHHDGNIRFVRCRGIVVRDESGRAIRVAGSQTDITAWDEAQRRFARAAKHDPLTGLPNRLLFSELLQREIAQSLRRGEARYAVLFVDLDGFKLVNDSLGHLIGDQFLAAIAQRIQSKLRPGDSLARLGGDEFAILVTDVGSVGEVRVMTGRMQRALTEPFVVQGREIFASASIGIVVGAERYQSVADLLRDADTAMYRAKAAGRGGYEIFDPAMHASAMERLTLETELRRAVERNEFVVHYQPIVELDSDTICGFEALVRWARPDGELVAPAGFLAVCEETGLIAPMTAFVLRQACQQVAHWQQTHQRPLIISVNVSSKFFGKDDLVEYVEAAIAGSQLVPGTLCIEITEGALMQPSETLDRNVAHLRAMHVPLYLDDFGTGYSSLSCLQRYPVDTLKLDRSFVARMGTDDDSAIANVIAKLARELGTGLIAEGVETRGQAALLLGLACPHAQGTLFSQPLPPDQIEALLHRAFSGTLAEAR